MLNGANGMSDMHGKTTRVVESEAGAERMNTETRPAGIASAEASKLRKH
jgi:hypothetical protein